MTSPSHGCAAWRGAAVDSALDCVLHTPRLVLEPLVERHAEELFEALQDPRLYTYVPQDPPESLPALRQRFALLARRHCPAGDELWLNWLVRGAADGRCRGRLQATVQGALAWIAYEVLPAYWRQGLAREGCACMLGWLIDALGVQQFAAEVDARNAASLRLLQRLGFHRTAWKIDADRFKGTASDEWTLRLAARDFVRQSAAAR